MIRHPASIIAIVLVLGAVAFWIGRTLLNRPKENRMPDDLVRALAEPDAFVLSHKVADVPDAVRQAYARESRGLEFAMADPDGAWEPTDMIRDASLPRRRLTTVATGKGYCILFYQRGGIARTDIAAVFHLRGNQADAVWRAYVPPNVDTPGALARVLKDNSYSPAPLL